MCSSYYLGQHPPRGAVCTAPHPDDSKSGSHSSSRPPLRLPDAPWYKMGDPASSYGQMFFGVLAATILFGITNLQTFVYFQWYPRDSVWTKLSVCWLWSLDALHVGLCAHIVYYYLVANYMNPEALIDIVWSFKAEISVVCVVTVSVQTLYCIRIWKLAMRVKGDRVQKQLPWLQWVLPPTVTVLVLVEYGVVGAVCWGITRVNTWSDLIQPSEYWMAYLPLGVAGVVDIVIAGCLCYLLGRYRTGFSTTDTAINALMRYVIETGLITALCAIAAIIINVTNPLTHGFAMLSLEFVLSKLYVNCFLAMLNARTTLRPETSDSEGISMTKQTSSYVSMNNQNDRLSYTQQYIRPTRGNSTRQGARSPAFVTAPAPTFQSGKNPKSPTYNALADLANINVTVEKYEYSSGLTPSERDSPLDPYSAYSLSGSSDNFRNRPF